ncbi:MAG: hypothetical protein MUC50_16075 [Myxococcota bacterium]|jgi:hypothetical protein|nr:hypothetical protein [Myxococcota bacterium]
MNVRGIGLCSALALAACDPAGDGTKGATDTATASDYGFEAHLLEAIAINEERKILYSERTGGQSELLSDLLIGSENALLPLARELDAAAEPFQEAGIPIISADFVPMSEIAPSDTPPKHRGELTASIKNEAAALIAPLAKLNPADFEAVCAAAEQALSSLEELEELHDVHLAMTRHLLESAAYAALHAIEYERLSDGATKELSRRLVAEQLIAPSRDALGPMADQMANSAHQLGVGIIVNDVPAIPFLAEYKSR